MVQVKGRNRISRCLSKIFRCIFENLINKPEGVSGRMQTDKSEILINEEEEDYMNGPEGKG